MTGAEHFFGRLEGLPSLAEKVGHPSKTLFYPRKLLCKGGNPEDVQFVLADNTDAVGNKLRLLGGRKLDSISGVSTPDTALDRFLPQGNVPRTVPV